MYQFLWEGKNFKSQIIASFFNQVMLTVNGHVLLSAAFSKLTVKFQNLITEEW